MARRLVCLIAAVLLAGCANVPTSPGGDQPPAPADLSHLSAPGADATNGNGTRIFLWDGTVGVGGNVPLAGTAPGSASATYTFPVDGNVGYVETSLESLDGASLIFMVRNETSRVGCGGSGNGRSCTVPVPVNIGGTKDWSVLIQSRQNDNTNPFRLNVTLHPRAHMLFGSILSPLDERFFFRNADTGFDGGEPSVGVTSTGTIFDVVGTATLRSRDEGVTWEDVRAPATTTSLDPMLFVDPWTDRVFVDHLYVGCSYLSWSDDEGETWTTNPVACGMPADDHQKICAGSHPLENALYPAVIYYTFNSFALLVDGAAHLVASRSVDGGVTWTSAIAMQETLDFPYRTGGPCVADRNGNAYIGAYLADGDFAVTTSNDYGVTWNARRAGTDSGGGQAIDPGVAVDTAGNVYGAYWGPKGVQVVLSTDEGATWRNQRVVSPEGLKSFELVDAVAGDEGRVAVAFIATADSDKGPNRADGWSKWHLYLAMSENAHEENATWVATRVTPEDDPVQIGSVCTGGTGCSGGNRNLLDFIDIQALPDGRVVIAYTDGCGSVCRETPQESRENDGYVAIQLEGRRLYEDKAPWASN
jgi:hypothetical protein